jgi:hypothetical protein
MVPIYDTNCSDQTVARNKAKIMNLLHTDQDFQNFLWISISHQGNTVTEIRNKFNLHVTQM